MTDTKGDLRMGVACSAFGVIGAVEAALGVLVPSLLDTFSLSTGSVTLLLASQIGGYLLAALLNGMVNSRLGLDRLLLVAFTLLASALLLYALTPRWDLMVATGVAVGLGIGLIDAGLNTAVAQHEAGARLIGPLHGFYGVGAVTGPAIATTVLALGGGWRQVYLVLAGLGGLVLLVIWQQRRAGPGPRAAGAAGGEWRVLGQALRRPAVGLSGLVLLAAVGLEASIGTWAFSVQHLGRSQSAVAAGIGVSLYWLGLTVGRFGFGGLVGRLGVIRWISGSLALLLTALIGWSGGAAPWLALPLAGFGLAGIFPATILLIPRRLPVALVPAAVGLATSAASAGAVAVPTSLGWIAAEMGLAAVPALLIPVGLGLAGLHVLLLPRHG
ncbi:MFS transporter [Cyanobium gracile]|uniref:Fucose permease n=1 Tax=Cyanobium gracile (strain ATCC 27147 / PCC 6307) TaxID=292564 RepID=K9PA70_CYAGP|nr:MFS transporter [Cyanobium gracile]AFY29474.1 fucose permease [Cyanobium gracile PCC 6307]